MTPIFATIIIFIIIIVAILYVRKQYGHDNLVSVKSNVDGNEYYVRQSSDQLQASNVLGTIRNNMMKLVNYLNDNPKVYPKNATDLKSFVSRIKTVEIMETPDDDKYTSYTVNKGEKMVFCIRSKIFNEIHNMNTIMYVVIHEMAHVACLEYGHTEQFKEIFTFLLIQSTKIGIYSPVDYRKSPVNYCGMMINEYLLDGGGNKQQKIDEKQDVETH